MVILLNVKSTINWVVNVLPRTIGRVYFISDRYVFYRVPEYLQSYLDYAPRQKSMPSVPYEIDAFYRYFPESRIWIKKIGRHYCVANLAKGGVIKVFDCASGDLILNDCGIIGRLDNRDVVTSQWIDPDYSCTASEDGWEVSGNMNSVPSNKLFSPLKNIIFRSVLLLIGWNRHRLCVFGRHGLNLVGRQREHLVRR